MIEGLDRVLVVGGGIGGMASAIALRQRGVPVDLIDNDPDWKVYGAGITITGPTLRAFRDLGLFDAIAEFGYFSVGGHMFLFNGTLLSETAAEPIEPGLPASGGIMRPKLHQIMSGETRRLGVGVRLGIEATAFEDDGEGVHVTFSDGTAARYDLVIASDGIYSKTRDMLFEQPAEVTYTGQMSWRVVGHRPPEMNVAHFYMGHETVGGITPCSPTEVYAFVLHPEPNPRRIPDDQKVEYLREKMKHFGGYLGEIRDAMGPESSVIQRPFEYSLQERPWHKSRIVLIGDAVHATTPHLASGAGMAVEDALVLRDSLERAGGDVETALEAFTERRFERCKFIVDSSVDIARRQLEHAPAEEIGMRMGQAMQRLAEPIL